MIGAGKPLASLSSGLLARKGQARPAMRPQGFSSLAPSIAALEDLGWDDLGPADPVPPVLTQREVLRQEIEVPAQPVAPAPSAPISVATAQRIGRDSAKQVRKNGKAAFTLRVDADRHLRLRLASAVANRSAQALVTEALDAFLTTMPEVDALVAHLPPPTTPKKRTS